MNGTVILGTVSTDEYAFGVAQIPAGFSVNTYDIEAEDFLNDVIPIHFFATEAEAFDYAIGQASALAAPAFSNWY